MDKQHILQEIRRTAKENGGVPLGGHKFFKETRIKKSDWGKYWARWSDAVAEAGFSPNKRTQAYDESLLFDKYISLIREIGRLPAEGDLRLKIHSDPDFPSDSTYRNRFGSKNSLIVRLRSYCQKHSGYEDIIHLCLEYNPRKESVPAELKAGEKIGFVYLLKHGSRREYRIGKTFDPVRREGEIKIQLPEKVKPVHYIETDDPTGIETYWFRRFAEKRKNGDWFALEAADVGAFKRWRKIW